MSPSIPSNPDNDDVAPRALIHEGLNLSLLSELSKQFNISDPFELEMFQTLRDHNTQVPFESILNFFQNYSSNVYLNFIDNWEVCYTYQFNGSRYANMIPKHKDQKSFDKFGIQLYGRVDERGLKLRHNGLTIIEYHLVTKVGRMFSTKTYVKHLEESLTKINKKLIIENEKSFKVNVKSRVDSLKKFLRCKGSILYLETGSTRKKSEKNEVEKIIVHPFLYPFSIYHHHSKEGHSNIKATYQNIEVAYITRDMVKSLLKKCPECIEIKELRKSKDIFSLNLAANNSSHSNNFLVLTKNSKNFGQLWKINIIDVSEHAMDSKGYFYILRVLDCYTRFSMLLPLKTNSITEITNNLRKCVYRYSSPTILQFESIDSELFENQIMYDLANQFNIILFNNHNTRESKQLGISRLKDLILANILIARNNVPNVNTNQVNINLDLDWELFIAEVQHTLNSVPRLSLFKQTPLQMVYEIEENRSDLNQRLRISCCNFDQLKNVPFLNHVKYMGIIKKQFENSNDLKSSNFYYKNIINSIKNVDEDVEDVAEEEEEEEEQQQHQQRPKKRKRKS